MMYRTLIRYGVSLCLAAAGLSLAPAAFACSNSSWASLVGNPVINTPANSVKRYAGHCAMRPAATGASYAIDNTPDGEVAWRVRFYVFTGNPGANVTVFRAYPQRSAQGTPVFDIRYRPGNALDLIAGGATLTSATGIAANRWYRVSLHYPRTGTATLVVQGATGAAQTRTAPVPANSPPIFSSALGVLNAVSNSNTLSFDAYGSSRTATLPTLCRGDANGDNAINIFDAVAVANERVRGILAPGTPDCNEDGAINIFDNACITALRLANTVCPAS